MTSTTNSFSPASSFSSILDEPGLLQDDSSQGSLGKEVERILRDSASGKGKKNNSSNGDEIISTGESGHKDSGEPAKVIPAPFQRSVSNGSTDRAKNIPDPTKKSILRSISGGDRQKKLPGFHRCKTAEEASPRGSQSPTSSLGFNVRRSRSGFGALVQRRCPSPKQPSNSIHLCPESPNNASAPTHSSILAKLSPRRKASPSPKSSPINRAGKKAHGMVYSTVMAPVLAGKMVVNGAVQAGTMASHAAADAGSKATHAVVGAGNAVVGGSKAIIEGTTYTVVHGSKAVVESTSHAIEKGAETITKSSRAIAEGTSTAVGMSGKSFNRSAKDMMKWASLKNFNTNIKSKKSKWEEGMDVIDQILEPECEAYKGLTPDQRDQLAAVKKLLIKGTNFGGLNNKNQHIPQDLLESMSFHPEGSLRGSVVSRNTDISQHTDILQQIEDEHDDRRRKSMAKSSQYILQEYAGVKDHSILLGDLSEPDHPGNVQSRRFNIHTDPVVDSNTASTADCSEALSYDDSEGSMYEARRSVLSSENYFVPPEFTYLSREDQLSVYELLKWDSIGRWDFNVFDLNKASNGSPLLFVGWAIMAAPYSQQAMAKELGLESEVDFQGGYNFMDELKIPPEKLYHFIRVIEQDYNMDNPYHNAIHGADVLQSLHVLLDKSHEQEFMANCPKLALFSILLSALCHDVAHFGTTNAFHNKLKTELSVMYNDNSVMENWHVAHAFARMLGLDLACPHNIQACEITFTKNCQRKQSECNLLCNATEEQFNAVRKMMIDAVLHTDMSNHFEMVNAARGMLVMDADDITGANDQGGNSANNNNTWRILMFMLHMADISGQAKTCDLSDLWTGRCMDEFFAQGDEEAKLGLPISPNCDRHTVIVSESQIGFIKFVIEPAFVVLADYIPFVKEEVLSNIQGNTLKFLEQREKEESAID